MKKVYTITGFDCAVCASKAESHISKNEDIKYCHIDFASNKLYIDFADKPWDIDKIKTVISEVESDPIFISDKNIPNNQINNIFTGKMYFTLVRIIVCVLSSLVCIFILNNNSFSLLRAIIYGILTVLIGYDVTSRVFVHIKHKNNILDHNLLISIAAIGAFILSVLEINEDHIVSLGEINIAMDDGMEAVMVITLFQVGQIIENIATNKSKLAVMSAVELRVDKANLVTKDGITVVDPEILNVGDEIVVTAGELIPIDGIVISGEGYVDTSSLTGEFIPVFATNNSKVFGGCLLKSGTFNVKVEKKYEDSTVSKILNLIENGGMEKSKADEFIAKFAKFYTPIVVALSILVLLIGGLISKNDWNRWIHTALEILVIGCPCAIVISVPLAYFSSIGLASKNGIVIKGTNYLDKLCDLGILVTDKTGTLTHGSFKISKVENINCSKDELLETLYSIESLSKHPIGKAICHDIKASKYSTNVSNFEEIAGLGVAGNVSKDHVIAGGERLLILHNISFEPANEYGSIVYCCKNGVYLGYVVLTDEIKNDAEPMVHLLHGLGIKILLLTGDNEDNAREISKKLGIDHWYSELLPEQKTEFLIKEMEHSDKAVAFIGDGINDAPSIIRSDIGIAMGGIGSDIAVENADIIIMNDDPAKVYDSIMIAKKSRKTSIFNISFALSIKFIVFVLALFFGTASWMMYVAILADTGLTVLLVLNSLLILSKKIKR